MRIEIDTGHAGGFAPKISFAGFADRTMVGAGHRGARPRAPLASDSGSSAMLRRAMADGMLEAMRRLTDERGGASTTAGDVLAAYGGDGGPNLRRGNPGSSAGLPSIRYGHDAEGHVRHAPERPGHDAEGYRHTPPAHLRGGVVGAGPGTDGHAHYRAKGGRGLTDEGRQRIASWMSFFMRPDAQGGMGLDRDKAMGMVGMMQGESGPNLNPRIDHYDVNGPSIGTAQWHDVDGRPGGRASALKAFAAKMGKPWTDVEVQQAFWKHEALTSENKAWQAIRAAPDGRGALAAGVRHYERPKFPEPEVAKRMPNYDRLKQGDFDQTAAAPERTPLPRTGSAAQPAPATAPGPVPQRHAAGVDFDTGDIERGIHHLRTFKAELAGLKGGVKVAIDHTHKHEHVASADPRAPKFSPFRSHNGAPAGRIIV